MNNAKRVKYTIFPGTSDGAVKDQIVPVIIENDPDDIDDAEDTRYTYTYALADVDDDGETEFVILSSQEVIIDENGHSMTLQELVENSTGEEVETIEQGEGTHTILNIVPSMHDDVDEEEEIDGVYKPSRCPDCGNCYSAAASLKLHMRACMRQHREVPAEDRKCSVCNKVFNTVAYLREHMKRHSTEQHFRCTRCYRKFIDEAKYNLHLEAHKHQDKLEAEADALAAQHGGKKVIVKEFTCSFCSENFTVAFEVGQVKRRYACDSCRDKYSKAKSLRQHKHQLEEKREFYCERCGRKFVFEGFLQRHLLTCDGSIKRRRNLN